MNINIGWLLLLWMLGGTACSSIKLAPKYGLSDGYYKKGDGSKVYVALRDDTVQVHTLRIAHARHETDSIAEQNAFPPQLQKEIGAAMHLRLRQSSFDIDFITIPVKMRFPVAGFPRQLNANLNGAVYLGRRADAYVLRYRQNPLGQFLRTSTHWGFSFGGFTGFGSTAMNPWVTNNAIDIEYDGMVWSKGIAAIVGINNFTAGVSFGYDHLLDKHRKVWMYQGRPWLGLTFGLNLN